MESPAYSQFQSPTTGKCCLFEGLAGMQAVDIVEVRIGTRCNTGSDTGHPSDRR